MQFHNTHYLADLNIFSRFAPAQDLSTKRERKQNVGVVGHFQNNSLDLVPVGRRLNLFNFDDNIVFPLIRSARPNFILYQLSDTWQRNVNIRVVAKVLAEIITRPLDLLLYPVHIHHRHRKLLARLLIRLKRRHFDVDAHELCCRISL